MEDLAVILVVWLMFNSTEPYRWEVNIGSGIGWVPSGTEPLPEPMLIHVHVAIRGPKAAMS